jgi:hypothetical protein
MKAPQYDANVGTGLPVANWQREWWLRVKVAMRDLIDTNADRHFNRGMT